MTESESKTANQDSPRRFVILCHEVGPGSERTDQIHWDWMFEFDGGLRTWATVPLIRLDQDIEVEAERLVDHRVKYLDYEGPVSNDRGQVWRVARGQCTVVSDEDDTLELQLQLDNVQTPSMWIRFYRNLVGESAGNRDVWRLRLARGRNETN